MESKTYIKNVRVTPKKLRFLLPIVRKMEPYKALDKLFYTPKIGAKVLYKAISTAISSAKQSLKVEDDKLKFKTIIIEEGQRLKRYRPGSRGAVKPFKKRFAHIKIVLTADKLKMKAVEPAIKDTNSKEANKLQLPNPKKKVTESPAQSKGVKGQTKVTNRSKK